MFKKHEPLKLRPLKKQVKERMLYELNNFILTKRDFEILRRLMKGISFNTKIKHIIEKEWKRMIRGFHGVVLNKR